MPQQKVEPECHHRKQLSSSSTAPRIPQRTSTSTLKLPTHLSCHTPRNLHVSRADSAKHSKAQRVARNSYVPLPPAPASAAAFLTEIGIRPFSQNTKHKAALCKLGPSCFLSATSPRAVPGLCPRELPTTPEAPLGRPRPRSPPPPPPALTRDWAESYLATGVRSGLYRGSAAPSRGCRPPVDAWGPTRAAAAPAPGSLRTSLLHRAEPARAAEIAVQPAGGAARAPG